MPHAAHPHGPADRTGTDIRGADPTKAAIRALRDALSSVWSTIGSSNLDRRSVVFNNEVDAIILGRNTAAQVEAVLRQDMAMAMAHEITLAEWRRRSLGERWDEIKARVWQYWM